MSRWVEKTDIDGFGNLPTSAVSSTLDTSTRESMLSVETVTLHLVLWWHNTEHSSIWNQALESWAPTWPGCDGSVARGHRPSWVTCPRASEGCVSFLCCADLLFFSPTCFTSECWDYMFFPRHPYTHLHFSRGLIVKRSQTWRKLLLNLSAGKMHLVYLIWDGTVLFPKWSTFCKRKEITRKNENISSDFSLCPAPIPDIDVNSDAFKIKLVLGGGVWDSRFQWATSTHKWLGSVM